MVMATPVRRAPAPGLPCAYGGADSSLIQALPALNPHPLATPMISRPANSQAGPWLPSTSTTAAIIDSATAVATTGRRPIRSDTRPAISRPGIRPTAYSPNMASTTAALRSSLARYISSSGVNWLAPQPITRTAKAARSQRAGWWLRPGRPGSRAAPGAAVTAGSHCAAVIVHLPWGSLARLPRPAATPKCH